MAQDVFSVEQVAAKLGLHVRTVRNYVRDGRLKAVRIGKQYRITAGDLAAFTGLPVAERAAAPTAELSGVAEIAGVDRAAADRIATMVVAWVNGPRDSGERTLRVETIHDGERATMKIIVLGDLAAGADLLRWIASITENLP
ncbi:MerR family transcriptional regulator [Amycolatopsis mediterranei S699]|uniref:MerR family transcriptional regulator n=2 Tax=Amycolatopsis mediterranei TaxID=33910 RepID=A0A0H3DE51_AMYMU|nr:helix-turn-helix domain-containing protein [Amycolatopsis mediterranei]ADJ48507.1 MerR family transcriptional regulator [Amycolatopsis mediterranei U32]AEK45432.1 MerR family transcriptional regulator [Amycolatopsis mediterranei S699]AFO80216.1 MerR family transcriptional regulator [Amycolatopsis mediterranei S699]AGT87344.1 MerR family transcriptional regulator [Amycolatopsis mediterranei RB]KDO10808.1 MerR family transcriptional regulator [Amycolatopsis mediterranei]